MKTALALCLIAGASGPTWAQERGQPVFVAPFDVLESHPLCKGQGKIAFRVPFSVKGATARFGLAEQTKSSARQCTIRTRRGSQVTELPIPCPEVEAPVLVAQNELADLPRKADLSGLITGCLELTGVSFVEGNWKLHVPTLPVATEVEGDLSSPEVRLLFSGVRAKPTDQEGKSLRASIPKLVILWDGIKVTVADRTEQTLTLSSYVVLAPRGEDGKMCVDDTCIPWNEPAYWTTRGMGSQEDLALIDFVEGR